MDGEFPVIGEKRTASPPRSFARSLAPSLPRFLALPARPYQRANSLVLMKSLGPKASVSSCNLIQPRIGFFSDRLTRNKAAVNPPSPTSETPLTSGTAGVFWAVARHLPGIYPRFAYLSAPLISGSERNDRETANDTKRGDR